MSSSAAHPKTYVGVGPYYVRSGLVDQTPVVNLPFPVHDDDAVSVRALKAYTDAYKITREITLSGTDYSDLQDDIVSGSLYVTVLPLPTDGSSANGPIGSWRLSRAGTTTIFTETVCKAQDLDTHLEVDWPAGGTPRVRKTTEMYDGTYLVAVQP